MSLQLHVIKTTTNPASAPSQVGQHWINTSNGNHYLSKGTSTVGDWALITSSTLVAVSATDTTPGFLSAKIAVDTGTNSSDALEGTTINGGGDEDFRIRLDSSKITLTNTAATATATTTTTSVTDVLLDNMTLTPASGTYFVTFSTSGLNSGNGAERNWYSIYVNGVQNAASERRLGIAGGATIPINTSAIVTVNGSQAIEIRWRVAAGTGTSYQRSLNCVRIGT